MEIDYQPLFHHLTELQEVQNRSHFRLGYPGGDSQSGLESLSTETFLAGKGARLLIEQTVGQLLLNNVGDPFTSGESHFFQHTHAIEREVIARMGRHLSLSAKPLTGHITSGGTGGNLTALWWLRNDLNLAGFQSISLVSSDSAHYSVEKIANIMGFPFIAVPTNADGSISLEALNHIAKALNGGIIFVANIGSTETCIIDPLHEINAILADAHPTNAYSIHLDAALMGPLIPSLINHGAMDKDALTLPRVRSLAISGHKYLGIQQPTGLFLAFNGLSPTSHCIDYLGGGDDTTIAGSRSGHAALYWLLRFLELGIGERQDMLENSYNSCIANAEYLTQSIRELAGPSAASYRPPGLQVVIKRPSELLMGKYQLMPLANDRAGVYVLPNTDREKLEVFVNDYQADLSH